MANTTAAKSLFVPLAMAVVFAMLTSYFLSRTLVPTLILFLLKGEAATAHGAAAAARPGRFARLHAGFERGFQRCQDAYGRMLAWALRHRWTTAAAFLAFVASAAALAPLVGRDFFPAVDGGQLRLHARCPAGTRLEGTE